jgi:hypothetical protein
LNGVAGYRFGVAVHDYGRPGLTDYVALWVTDPNHALIGHCTFAYQAVSGGDTVVSAR